MTVKQLKARAKSLEIAGYGNMTKQQLIDAISAAEAPQLPAMRNGGFIKTPPWRARRYHVVGYNPDVYAKLPPQAKAIFDFMTQMPYPMTGAMIVSEAVAAGKLKTRQDPAVLYAFYARKLENAGVMLA